MPVPVIAMDEVPKQSHIFDSEIPTLAKGGLESGLSQRRPRCATPPIIGSADACPMSLRDTAAAPHPLSEMCRKI